MYKDQGFTVVAVETTNRPEMAQEFLQSIEVGFPTLNDDTRSVGGLFGVRYTPTNIVLDRDGRVYFTTIGYAPGKEAALAAQVEYLLKK
jgi:peroxiredoxin